MKDYELDLNALWRTIYGEAEPGDELDAIAIGWTVLNRLKWPNWPNTVRGVCYQPRQYSCWNSDNPRLAHLNEVPPDFTNWTRYCYELAQQLLSDSPPPDPTNGATHYHATYIKTPQWARGKTPTLETDWGKYTHRFYNDIDTPPPRSAVQALEQERPIEETRTVKAGKVGGAVSGVAVVAGAIAEAGPAMPVLKQAADFIQSHATLALVLFGVAALLAIGSMIYARIDDRRRGLR